MLVDNILNVRRDIMKLDLKILDSSVKHIKGKEDLINVENRNFQVLKEEDFAFQILIKGDLPFFCSLEKTKDIHWRGLNEKIRIDISEGKEILDMSFLGYVINDDGSLVGDPILKHKSLFIEDGLSDDMGFWKDSKGIFRERT